MVSVGVLIIKRIILATMLITTAACSYIPFAGGALDGDVAQSLGDWRNIAQVSIIQLETRPEEPYSVKVWMIAEENHLYVYAGDKHSQWAQNIDQNPDVRLKVEDKIYELRAARVMDETEFQQFALAWRNKYSSDRTDSKANDSYLYRLTSRVGVGG